MFRTIDQPADTVSKKVSDYILTAMNVSAAEIKFCCCMAIPDQAHRTIQA